MCFLQKNPSKLTGTPNTMKSLFMYDICIYLKNFKSNLSNNYKSHVQLSFILI